MDGANETRFATDKLATALEAEDGEVNFHIREALQSLEGR
jgi:hypothetical protein